jgi:hypothetical protein
MLVFTFTNHRSFSCDQYKIFFNLWGNGGAQWQPEYKKYCDEESKQWTEVLGKQDRNRRSSYVDVVKGHHLTGTNKVPLGNLLKKKIVFQRIEWPQNLTNSGNRLHRLA